jgi:3-hydroxybutyrate dehydrogenase
MIASAHALVASPFKSAYVAAKHGVAGLTKTIALETADFRRDLQRDLPRLRADAAGRDADSGYRQSPRHHRGRGDQRCAAGGAADQGQFVTIAQVASLALYLCRPEAAQITGTTLSMDGGWTAK